jgi:ADP-ribose pyrophosphatase YjhB (NUDIX family)
MHKNFYASGFLYHSRSQQILLQQQTSADKEPTWFLFGGEGSAKETGEETFSRVVNAVLRLKLKAKAIFPVYKYFHEEMSRDHYISYAKIGRLEKFPETKNAAFAWFSFKQVQKLNLSEQTKHDIMVAQRVIDSATRRSLGQQTID